MTDERRITTCLTPQCKTQVLQDSLDKIALKVDNVHDVALALTVEVKHLAAKSQDQYNRDAAIFSRLNGLEHGDHHQHLYTCINNCVTKKDLSLYGTGLIIVFSTISFILKVI
jgi:hypothetical protein